EKFYNGMWKQAKKSGEEEKLRNAIDLSKRLKLYRSPAIVKRMFKSVHDSFGGRISFIEGGAAADPFIIEEFEAMGIPLIQGYGMSECAPIIALNRDRYRMAGPVGQPVQNAEVRVVNQDEDGIGEVIVKSDSVMLGYFEDPEATAEVIRDGWLHTGDLGYFDSEGFLYLTGRSKTVIVTKGGKNIFPEEVEQVFERNPFISEVLVYGTEDEHVGNVIITAEIFPDQEALTREAGELSPSEVYHFFRDLTDEINKEMPPYKAVRRIRIRETEFIKTTSGKIKRYGNRSESAYSEEFDNERPVDYRDIKKRDQRQTADFLRRIRKTTDPAVAHRDLQAVSDVRELLANSADRFGSKVWYRETEPITYQQVWMDITGAGTALKNRGIEGIIGIGGEVEPKLLTALLTLLSGAGTALLLDTEAGAQGLAWQMKNAGAETVITDAEQLSLFAGIAADGASPLSRIIVCGELPEELPFTGGAEILSWDTLCEEGKSQAAQGDRQFIDAEVTAADEAVIVYPDSIRSRVTLTHATLTETVLSAASLGS
ncbi:MAG: AMP-binding protein, partial [Mogibacterium sp.]|nr:AMP-binding protein [Mogibacterium sp.]